MTYTRKTVLGLLVGGIAALSLSTSAYAVSSAELTADANKALQMLYRSNAAAASMGRTARAILVFPNIVKAGLVVGGSFGEGILQKNGRTTGYYNAVSASWGLQAGAQSYGYAVFLMNDKAVEFVDKTDGWEIGVGPTVVVVDKGAAANLSTSTLKDDAYAFIFNQEGLMAGVSIEGTKISRINKD